MTTAEQWLDKFDNSRIEDDAYAEMLEDCDYDCIDYTTVIDDEDFNCSDADGRIKRNTYLFRDGSLLLGVTELNSERGVHEEELHPFNSVAAAKAWSVEQRTKSTTVTA